MSNKGGRRLLRGHVPWSKLRPHPLLSPHIGLKKDYFFFFSPFLYFTRTCDNTKNLKKKKFQGTLNIFFHLVIQRRMRQTLFSNSDDQTCQFNSELKVEFYQLQRRFVFAAIHFRNLQYLKCIGDLLQQQGIWTLDWISLHTSNKFCIAVLIQCFSLFFAVGLFDF